VQERRRIEIDRGGPRQLCQTHGPNPPGVARFNRVTVSKRRKREFSDDYCGGDPPLPGSWSRVLVKREKRNRQLRRKREESIHNKAIWAGSGSEERKKNGNQRSPWRRVSERTRGGGWGGGGEW